MQSKNVQTTKKHTEEGKGSSSQGTFYESTRSVVPAKYAGDATHTSEIDTATDR